MKKQLIIAIGIGAFLGFKSPLVLAGEGGMADMGSGSFARRFDSDHEIKKMIGVLSYDAEGRLSLIDDKGLSHRILNPSEAESLIRSGKMQVAMDVLVKADNEIKVVRVKAL